MVLDGCLVLSVVQVRGQIVRRAALHLASGLELQSPAGCVHYAPVADVGMVAALLRTNVGMIHVCHLLSVDA